MPQPILWALYVVAFVFILVVAIALLRMLGLAI